MKQPKFFTLALASFLLVVTAGAQAQTDLQNRLSQCAGIDNVLERLACYDEISDADNTTVQQPAPSPTTPVVVRPQPARPVAEATHETVEAVEQDKEISSFGQEPGPAQARVETTDTGEKELVDTVTEIKPIDPTRVLITLASGQIWRQTVGKRYLLREGDTVRITPTSWGEDYRLSADGKRGYIQVNRAR